MVVLVTCKNEEDPLKNKGARVVTELFMNFQTLKGSRRWDLDLFKHLCLSLLPVRMKKIHPKMKVLEWSQHSPIISPRRFLQTLKGK